MDLSRMHTSSLNTNWNLPKSTENLDFFEKSENNFWLWNYYPEIILIWKNEENWKAKIIISNNEYYVLWDSEKNEIKTLTHDNSRKFIVVSKYEEEWKVSLLVWEEIIFWILEKEPFYMDNNKGQLFFVIWKKNWVLELKSLEKDDYNTYYNYKWVVVNSDEDFWWDFINSNVWIYQLLWEGLICKTTSLQFLDSKITNIRKRNRDKKYLKWNFKWKEIEFYFNPDLPNPIPYIEMNSIICFMDDDNFLIYPELLVNYGTLDTEYKRDWVKWFKDKSLFKIGHSPNTKYTDWENIYVFKKSDLALHLSDWNILEECEEVGDFDVYNNPDSVYNGYPLVPIPYTEWRYWDNFTWTYWKDYVIVASNKWNILLLFKNWKEIIIDINSREEVKTKHSEELWKWRFIWLHPKEWLVVLWRNLDTTYYRYYSVNSNWNLVYIWSKENVFPDNYTDNYNCKYGTGRWQERCCNYSEYSILNDTNWFPVSYMSWTTTFIAVKEKENKYSLLCLNASNYRNLNEKDSFDIPEELIENWVIKDENKVKKLVQFLPGNSIIYNPWKCIKMDNEYMYFCSLNWNKNNSKKVEKLPTIKVWDREFYILKTDRENSILKFYLFDNYLNESPEEIESLDYFYTKPNHLKEYDWKKGLTKISEDIYIYPPMIWKYPDKLRMALLFDEKWEPKNSFVIFYKEKNEITSIDTDNYPISTSKENEYILDNWKNYTILDIESWAIKAVTEYEWLITNIDNNWNITYSKNNFKIKLNNLWIPEIVEYEWNECYITTEISELNWKTVYHLCLKYLYWTILPFYKKDWSFFPVFEIDKFKNNIAMKLTDFSMDISNSSMDISNWDLYCQFDVLWRFIWEEYDSKLLEKVYDGWNLSLFRCVYDVNKGYKSSLYIVYKDGENNICEKTQLTYDTESQKIGFWWNYVDLDDMGLKLVKKFLNNAKKIIKENRLEKNTVESAVEEMKSKSGNVFTK